MLTAIQRQEWLSQPSRYPAAKLDMMLSMSVSVSLCIHVSGCLSTAVFRNCCILHISKLKCTSIREHLQVLNCYNSTVHQFTSTKLLQFYSTSVHKHSVLYAVAVTFCLATDVTQKFNILRSVILNFMIKYLRQLQLLKSLWCRNMQEWSLNTNIYGLRFIAM